MKPPLLLWLCFAYLCKPLFMLMAGSGLQYKSADVLSLFYPKGLIQTSMLTISGVAVALMLLVGAREKFWHGRWRHSLRIIKPVLLTLLLTELLMVYLRLEQQRWAFSWPMSTALLLNLTWLAWLMRSRHMRIMLRDWLTPQT